MITHLAISAPLPIAGQEKVIWPHGVGFTRCRMPLADYRALYDQVGRKWHWVNRRHLNDQQLAVIVHHPATETHVLSRDGANIGFVELNFKLSPQVEIVFVGLVEEEIGQGFGYAMIREALRIIQARNPTRVIIQTCTLDHPTALPLYQRIGFKAYDRKWAAIIDD